MLTLETNHSFQISQDNSKKISQVDAFGSKGIIEFSKSIRHFTHRSYNSAFLKFKFNEINQNTFKDENVEIEMIKCRNTLSKRRKLNSTIEKYFVSYIVKGPTIKAKFDKEKLKTFKISRPDHFKKLLGNENVVLEDGSVVCPQDVFYPRKPRDVFFIIDIASVEIIDDLVEKFEIFKKEILRNNGTELLNVIFHIVEDDLVFEDSRYQNWIKGWGNNVKHVILNRSYCGERLTATSSARIQKKMSMLNDFVFRPPWYDNIPKKHILGGKSYKFKISSRAIRL